MTRALKSHLKHADQIALLKARGLAICDDGAAVRALAHYGYYRLAGYCFPLREQASSAGASVAFRLGSSLELVCQIAEFDKSLRLLVLNAIETIEIATRVAIAYRLGELDATAHLKPRFLDGKFCCGSPSKHDRWVQKYQATVKSSKEDFVIHHRLTYGGAMPIWVGIELWSFGDLSKFYEGMKHKDRAAIANLFGGLDGADFGSWLRNLSFARNVAAHHGRLWNRTNPESPRLPSTDRAPKLTHLTIPAARRTKLYTTLCLLRTLLVTCESDLEWHRKLKSVARMFPATPLIGLSAAGFPDDWDTLPLWA